MDFEGVAGFFQSALAGGRLSHAHLFLGQNAWPLAQNLAGLLLCRAPDGALACGRCPDCRQVGAGFHPDLTVVAPASASIKIEQIRELQRSACLAPYQAGRKVFIVNEAHKMTDDAANCLLKSLEEPVDNVFFILVADSGEGLLPTVVSRCQKFFVTAPAEAEDPLVERLSEFMAAWGSRDIASLLKLGESLAEDKKVAGRFLDQLALFYRNRVVGSETGNTDPSPWEETTGAWRTRDLARCLDRVETAKRHLAANANTRLMLDSLFLHLAGEA
ncbi:MAG: hypothetical protein M0Z41_21655 [Peptococcaceae bacterium]|jgi:DNA polymerase-3 subunit delta'|nr:hypothetical protein [Peptococcaceae bacterium]